MRKFLHKKAYSKKLVWYCILLVFILPFPSVWAQVIEQPIIFSHITHAGVNQIACEFCHIYARRSLNSGVPPVQNCIGCHSVVLGSTPEQKAEIKKIKPYWDNKQPIPWKKIHDNPDFVYFSHKRHLNIGLDCTNCHGDIAKMAVVQRVTPLTMGWCLSCHNVPQPALNGKIAGPVRATRGGPILQPAPTNIKSSILTSRDCYLCHK